MLYNNKLNLFEIILWDRNLRNYNYVQPNNYSEMELLLLDRIT